MDAPNRPIIPPAPPVHARDLNAWQLVRGTTSNLLGVWAERHFDELSTLGRVLGQDNILLSDPADARTMLSDRGEIFGRPPAFVRPLRPLGGAGLLLSEGEDWRRQRRMLAPLFSPARISGLLPHFAAAGDNLATRLAGTKRANLSDEFHRAALDAVMRALFSIETDGDRHGLAAMVRSYLTGPGQPTVFDGMARDEADFTPWLGWSRRRFRRQWFAKVGALVAERRRTGPKDNGDLLDLLLGARDPETGEALDNTEICYQAATMLVAGFETTSRLLFWATYLLALDQVEQARIRAEVTAHDPDRVKNLDDLAAWPRLRQTLFETLRLYPPVSVLIRVTRQPVRLAGHEVKTGSLVWVSPWVMHRHRKFWDNPTAFMPDRFAGKPQAYLTEDAFLPFAIGPRICIGAAFSIAEASIVLARLLRRFEISLESDRPVLPKARVTTLPDHEPWFRLGSVSTA
jgi:cytochrome P450